MVIYGSILNILNREKPAMNLHKRLSTIIANEVRMFKELKKNVCALFERCMAKVAQMIVQAKKRGALDE